MNLFAIGLNLLMLLNTEATVTEGLAYFRYSKKNDGKNLIMNVVHFL